MDINQFYMKRALELARLGWGKTNPNPLVGAVIVANGKIVGEGYHEKIGGDHAEVSAFLNARCDVAGATLYVNLEPCSHYGRTPPCAKAIIEKGIKEVVIAMADPNPKVSGRGIQMLKDAGISVVMGVLEEEAKKLNEIFIKYITRKAPFVIMKTAMTLDGKIATVTGDSKWVSGAASREHVHEIRERVASIMVGSQTVLHDNPSLTARRNESQGRNPLRIIIDSKGIIPIQSKVLNKDPETGAILATTSAISGEKEKQLLDKGIKVLKLDGDGGHVDLARLMHELYSLEIDSILLEGGGGLNAAALNAGIVDKVMMFIAPKIIGGADAVTPVEGQGIALMRDAIELKDIHIERFDQDILVEGYLKGEICLPES